MEFSGKDFVDGMEQPEPEIKSGFAHNEDFKAAFRIIEDILLKQSGAQRIVVFVDDLDRCEPENVLNPLYRLLKQQVLKAEYLNVDETTMKVIDNHWKMHTDHILLMLDQQRLALEAKLLLAKTKLSTKLISYELGFDDPAYFCKFFEKMTGMKPMEYRDCH